MNIHDRAELAALAEFVPDYLHLKTAKRSPMSNNQGRLAVHRTATLRTDQPATPDTGGFTAPGIANPGKLWAETKS